MDVEPPKDDDDDHPCHRRRVNAPRRRPVCRRSDLSIDLGRSIDRDRCGAAAIRAAAVGDLLKVSLEEFRLAVDPKVGEDRHEEKDHLACPDDELPKRCVLTEALSNEAHARSNSVLWKLRKPPPVALVSGHHGSCVT